MALTQSARSNPTSQYGVLTQEDNESLDPMSLLHKIDNRDHFHDKRTRCLFYPKRAMETLEPYAFLEVTVAGARDLLERDAGFFKAGDIECDPFVEVYQDDIKVEHFQTPIARGTRIPYWRYSNALEVLAPASMVRFQVKDDQAAGRVNIGFVEICIGDIPYNTPIEGWFELRFQENLQSTSAVRYKEHCQLREEKTMHQQKEAQAEEAKKAKAAPPKVETLGEASEDLGRPLVTQLKQTNKQRALGLADFFADGTAKIAENLGLPTLAQSLKESAGVPQTERYNAGEIYLKLNLKRACSLTDSLFALALNPPMPQDFGTISLMDTEKEQVDIQYVYDRLWEFKVKIVDDFLLCIFYHVKYIVSWRNPFITGLLLASWLLACVRTYRVWVVIPGQLALFLVLNMNQTTRLRMTRGGLNARLDNEGFAAACAWNDSGEIYNFVKRLVEDDLHGQVKDEKALRQLAARTSRDGLPDPAVANNLDALRKMLRLAKCVTVDGADDNFSYGDLVLVDQRDRAKVDHVHLQQVYVVFEAGADPFIDGFKTLPRGTPVAVDIRRVKKRVVLTSVPKMFIQPAIGTALTNVVQILEVVKFALLPLVKLSTAVVTWQKANYATILVAILTFVFVMLAFGSLILAFNWKIPFIGDYEYELTIGLTMIDNVMLTAVVVAIFILQASWFQGLISIFTVIGRAVSQKRKAPENWAFFRKDPKYSQLVTDAMGSKNAWASQTSGESPFQPPRAMPLGEVSHMATMHTMTSAAATAYRPTATSTAASSTGPGAV